MTEKLSEVLRKAHENKTQQTTGYLVRFDSVAKTPTSYCALGALACNKHHFKNESDYYAWIKAIEDSRIGIYEQILIEYGVPGELINTNYNLEFDGSLPVVANTLPQLIYKLNDQQGFTFEQLADLLETNLGL